jgi:hypothetical protein
MKSACALSSTPEISDPYPNRKKACPETKYSLMRSVSNPPNTNGFLTNPYQPTLIRRNRMGIYDRLARGQTLYSLSRFYQVPLDTLVGSIVSKTPPQPGPVR